MSLIKPIVGKTETANGQTFYNFPISEAMVKIMDANSFTVNGKEIFSIDFNKGQSRWCYDNENYREIDFMNLLGKLNLPLDVNL